MDGTVYVTLEPSEGALSASPSLQARGGQQPDELCETIDPSQTSYCEPPHTETICYPSPPASYTSHGTLVGGSTVEDVKVARRTDLTFTNSAKKSITAVEAKAETKGKARTSSSRRASVSDDESNTLEFGSAEEDPRHPWGKWMKHRSNTSSVHENEGEDQESIAVVHIA